MKLSDISFLIIWTVSTLSDLGLCGFMIWHARKEILDSIYTRRLRRMYFGIGLWSAVFLTYLYFHDWLKFDWITWALISVVTLGFRGLKLWRFGLHATGFINGKPNLIARFRSRYLARKKTDECN